MSDLSAAREWLAKQLESGYVDVGFHDDEEMAHLRALAVDRTCATCRWAEPDGGMLRCTRVEQDDSLAFANGSNADGDATLTVRPTFGCVQWEGK